MRLKLKEIIYTIYTTIMAYGFYLRKNRRKFRKVKVQSKTPVVATYKYPKKYVIRKKATFAQKVNQIISRNVENKFTNTIIYNDAVARCTTVSSVDTFTFFTWSPGADVTGARLFNINPGTLQNTRIGNTIKLKRWVIKGIIEPVISETRQFTYSNVGYVDVYFGKLLKNTAPPSNTLEKLYQNGGSATTPACKSSDMLNPLNRDQYKVYYHRRFKMGYASDYNTYNAASGSNEHPANNDFKASQTFGFDVTKYILKNKPLKFPDYSALPATFVPPDNPDIVNLTIWATWTPLTSNSVGASTSSKSLYNINCLTYAEYEDA